MIQTDKNDTDVPIELIVATTEKGGIGKNQTIPWPGNKDDMTFFRNTTTQTKDPSKMNAVIMGSKTFLSIPAKFRPLPKRYNVILTRKSTDIEIDEAKGIIKNDLKKSIEFLSSLNFIETIFICGGGEIYKQSLETKDFKISKIHLTIIDGQFDSDTFIDLEKIRKDFNTIQSKQAQGCTFHTLTPK